jgi:hypothetical protein
LFADNNKVHCLVNADLLDYDVSDKGEKSLERHMKSAENKGNASFDDIVVCLNNRSIFLAYLTGTHVMELPSPPFFLCA